MAQVIDLGKFGDFYKQIDEIQTVVNKLITKQNGSVYNKIGTKTEVLFNSISQIDVKNAPVEDIRSIIDMLKKLKGICLTLSAYKKYLETILDDSINNLSQGVSNPKKLELQNNEVNVA
jgi:hypothetical protein